MFIEYYRKRRAGLPDAIVYLESRGIAFEIPYRKPIEVPDEMAYKVLAKFGDICRQVEDPVKETPKKKTVKKSKKTKEVTNYETA